MNEALQAKKEQKELQLDKVITTKQDVRIRVHPVSPIVINDVKRRVKKPKIPMWHNEDMGRDEPNPNDPDYLDALDEYNGKIGEVMMDAAAVFGIELVDPLPEDETWLPKVKFMIRQGYIDDTYNLDDPDEKKFLYIRYFAVGTDELMMAMQGILPEEAVIQQRESFPGDEERNADTSTIIEE